VSVYLSLLFCFGFVYAVGPQMETLVYTDGFFTNLDVVVNALDSVEARKYMDRSVTCVYLK